MAVWSHGVYTCVLLFVQMNVVPSGVWKCDIYISIQTLYSVLWSTFGSNYSLESSWVWRYKLGTLVYEEFLPFFSADPLKLRSLQRCSIGFQSRLWLGHSRTFRDLSRSHFCVFAVCLGLLSCWKVNRHPSQRSWAGFHQVSLCTLLCLSFPRSWLVSQSLLLKNIPTAWCCHHNASP